jgi:2-(3-amino-3-carboxypropyl)histidine synthase
MQYNLELDKAIAQIKKNKAKTVCIQLPDGLKPEAKNIADTIEKQTKAKVTIWLNSCFGGCDVPNLKVDLLIQWGHSRFKK